MGTLTNSTSGAIDISETWNAAGTAFQAPIRVIVTDTASNANSLLLDIQTAALGSVLFVTKAGRTFGQNFNTVSGLGASASFNGTRLYLDAQSSNQIVLNNGGANFGMLRNVANDLFTLGSSSTGLNLSTSSLSWDGLGNAMVGAFSANATTATDGFLYIPTCAGPPTGTPTAYTGKVPLVYDSTNNQLYVYNGGWKQPKTPAAAAIVNWQ